ncbi:MAG: DUF2283 domain-containing protein [Nanoarchaeota archaeon]|nr:DUF2283 domain-containing protein [Nanoarchaeota archaeon]
MKEKNFDYDNFSDSLIISRKKQEDVVQGSAEVGNLILDFNSSGKIVNVEFRHISKFLKMMNVNPNILQELKDAELIVHEQKGAVSLFALLKTPTLNQPIPLATIPVNQQSVPFA